MCFSRYVAAAACLLLTWPSGSLGQQAAPEATSLPLAQVQPAQSIAPAGNGRTAAPHVEQIQPDTYLLPDQEGRLQPMLGWTFEDFLRVWKSRETSPQNAEEPAFSLQRVECTAELEDQNFVHLHVRIEIRLQADGRTSVPLAFPSGILTGYSLDSDDDSTYVHFDEGLGEHVLWTGAADGQSLVVRLDLLLPLARRGDQSVLRFHAPRAVVSNLKFTLPAAGLAAESLSPGMRITTAAGDGKTVVEAAGLAETTEIAWRSLNSAQGESPALVADSDIRVSVERGMLRSDVSLVVQDLQGALERFRIRLPDHHTLRTEDTGAATLHHVADKESTAAGTSEADSSAADVYEVRLTEPQQAPLRLNLVLERPLPLEEEESLTLISGVDVIGAIGQQGLLQIAVSEDLRVRWQEGQRVRQVAAPPEPAAMPDVTAAFEFDAPEWQLPLLIALRPAEVSVEPDYLLEISQEELRLTATFQYSVRGTKRIDLRYALGPWTLAEDPSGPVSTISAGNTYVDAAGTMYLPLTNPAEGAFETTLRLMMPRPTASGLAQIRLPESLDGRLQEGQLHVTAEPALEVVAQPQSFVGLNPAPRTSSTSSPPPLESADRPTQHFRVLSLPAEYVALVRPRTRTVQNETRVALDVYADQVLLEQEIHLDVRHLPLSEVLLRVPVALADNPSAALEVDGQSVAPDWENLPVGASGDQPRRARLVLEQPRLGDVSIRLRYQMPLASPGGSGNGGSQSLVVPLAMPDADSHRIAASLTNHAAHLQAQFRRPAGENSETAPPHPLTADAEDRTHLDLTGPADALPIAIRPASTRSERSMVVERMWIQSWVIGDAVHTRSVLRLVPTSREITILLPEDAPGELRDAQVNSRPASYLSASDRELVLDVSELPADAPCVIEIFQRSPYVPSAVGEVRVAPPRIAPARGYQRVFWQLVLPSSLHGFSVADDLVNQTPWRREGIYWARFPAFSQADLEDFVGVPHVPAPAGTVNELLSSGFELPPVLEAVVVRRSFGVLVFSGMALAAGLVVIYVRALQRLAVGAAATVLLAVSGALYPELAPFVVQAGVLGIVLILVAIFLRKLAGQWPGPNRGRSAADTSIFRRETPSPTLRALPSSGAEASSSARTAIPSLSESGAQNPA